MSYFVRFSCLDNTAAIVRIYTAVVTMMLCTLLLIRMCDRHKLTLRVEYLLSIIPVLLAGYMHLDPAIHALGKGAEPLESSSRTRSLISLGNASHPQPIVVTILRQIHALLVLAVKKSLTLDVGECPTCEGRGDQMAMCHPRREMVGQEIIIRKEFFYDGFCAALSRGLRSQGA